MTLNNYFKLKSLDKMSEYSKKLYEKLQNNEEISERIFSPFHNYEKVIDLTGEYGFKFAHCILCERFYCGCRFTFRSNHQYCEYGITYAELKKLDEEQNYNES